MKLRYLFAALCLCLLLVSPAAAAGGSGTAADPYVIETAAELQSISNNLAAYYILGNDIDMSGYSFTPIGTTNAPFIGSLDGNNYKIKYLSSSNGFFYTLSSGANIKDITFEEWTISLTGTYAGVLCGKIVNADNVYISNINCIRCSVTSTSHYCGGLIGGISYSDVTLIDCNINDCTIIGGASRNSLFIGQSLSSSLDISNCNIQNSYVRSQTHFCGGLIGENTGGTINIDTSTVSNSIIYGLSYVNGGLIGENTGGTINIDTSTVSNCIVSGNTQCGGLCARVNSASLTANSCEVLESSIFSTSDLAGGIVGNSVNSDNSLTINFCEVLESSILSPTKSAGVTPATTNNNLVSLSSNRVINTNIYGSSIYDIGQDGSYDSTSTASGITNVPNRYLYASGISYSLAGSTVTLTLENRQGAAVIETSTGAAATDIWNYNDGTTGTADTHTYASGIYSPGLTISSYLAPTPQPFYTLPINIGIPTYAANTITQQDADIVIDAGQLYQAQTQFVLPSTTSDLEFFADNVFVVASGNAVYLIDTATEQIESVSNTTGTTAEKIYLGEHAAIITDIDGNTAVYQYAENSFDYLASGDNQQIATTQNYAGIIINGKLNIYDLSEPRKIGDISASVSQLAGNDYADTFAGYSGTTFYYWWIDNGEIKSGSQTMPNPITEVKQIPQTQNYITTTEKNTITVSVSSIGEYSKLSTSATELPLTHVQATTIGVTIGVHAPNEIYIVGADGSTAGTYQTGATLNDASISKATGLYAITGGIDQQAYILRKDQSSTWALAQTIRANGVLSHTQISTNGQYAAIVNGVNLYLLKLSTSTDTTYYLQGVVISSTGSLYANKVITINGEKVTTDLSGRFTYAVTPGSLYRIVADTTTTEYTATNTVLQTIAIKLKPNPFAQSVSYSTDYNADTRNFEMTYTDTRDLTSSVTWVIRETGNQTIVSTQTTQAGQTAYWEVPLDKSFTSYQISMIADRQGTNVENTWIITPDGKNPINIPGLDETGKTILFGAVLMIFGGLFGVMHSTKGALLTVLLAGVFAYLGLLNIPTTVIMVAATLAVAALLAKGSGGS